MFKALICWFAGHRPMKMRKQCTRIGWAQDESMRIQITSADEKDLVCITVCDRCHAVYAVVSETPEHIRKLLGEVEIQVGAVESYQSVPN